MIKWPICTKQKSANPVFPEYIFFSYLLFFLWFLLSGCLYHPHQFFKRDVVRCRRCIVYAGVVVRVSLNCCSPLVLWIVDTVFVHQGNVTLIFPRRRRQCRRFIATIFAAHVWPFPMGKWLACRQWVLRKTNSTKLFTTFHTTTPNSYLPREAFNLDKKNQLFL
jgi:hypothetical protein